MLYLTICLIFTDMARLFVPNHNYLINLDPNQPGTEPYHEIFAFLRRSRINHVLTHAPILCEPYLQDFWNNASCDKVGDIYVFHTTVAGQVIEFTAADLIGIFRLGTAAQEGGELGLTTFRNEVIRGAFLRLGFTGDLSTKTIFKKGFFGRWRYLAHVLLVGLSNKKTGFDT